MRTENLAILVQGKLIVWCFSFVRRHWSRPVLPLFGGHTPLTGLPALTPVVSVSKFPSHVRESKDCGDIEGGNKSFPKYEATNTSLFSRQGVLLFGADSPDCETEISRRDCMTGFSWLV